MVTMCRADTGLTDGSTEQLGAEAGAAPPLRRADHAGSGGALPAAGRAGASQVRRGPWEHGGGGCNGRSGWRHRPYASIELPAAVKAGGVLGVAQREQTPLNPTAVCPHSLSPVSVLIQGVAE